MITFSETRMPINTIIGNGKRFMAYEIVKRLQNSKQVNLLKRLGSSLEPERLAHQKLHDIWRYSFDWKHCESDRFKYQKLNYIHANPCSGKWNLSINPESYTHSSAGFYATGHQGIYPVDNLDSMKDIAF